MAPVTVQQSQVKFGQKRELKQTFFCHEPNTFSYLVNNKRQVKVLDLFFNRYWTWDGEILYISSLLPDAQETHGLEVRDLGRN
jgi:hypothetical protein